MIDPGATGRTVPTLSGSSGCTWMLMSNTSFTGLSRFPRPSGHDDDTILGSYPRRDSE